MLADKRGQIRTFWDNLGQIGTMRLDATCHKEPQKATRGHEKQPKATESHKNKSDSRRQFATKNYNRRQLEDSCGQFGTLCYKRLQMGATENSWGSKGAAGCIRGQFRTKGDTRSVIWAR